MSNWTTQDSRRLTGRGILAVNFHELLPENRAEAERRLASLSRIGPSWSPESPAGDGVRVFVGFYDGYRETAFWGAEVCSALGLRACFFPIFAGDVPGNAELDDDDLRLLSREHDVGFHTASHLFITEVTTDNLDAEVVAPIRRIEAATGRPPQIGAWCGGSRFDADHVGNQALRDLGVRFMMSNWSVEAISD